MNTQKTNQEELDKYGKTKRRTVRNQILKAIEDTKTNQASDYICADHYAKRIIDYLETGDLEGEN